jgi:hypothetical protein
MLFGRSPLSASKSCVVQPERQGGVSFFAAEDCARVLPERFLAGRLRADFAAERRGC